MYTAKGRNMTEVSKQVANREAIARTVANSAARHGPEVVNNLEQVLFPTGVPAELSMGLIVEALGRALVRPTARRRAGQPEEADLTPPEAEVSAATGSPEGTA